MRKPIQVKENAPRQWRIPPLKAEDNKYSRGCVVILGGDEMTGAARLAALAAQRAGAGLVTIAATKASWPIYAASLMSVITKAMDGMAWKKSLKDHRLSAVLIGPGAGLNARTNAAMRAAATSLKPLVLDADALTILSADTKLRRLLIAAPKILTPHEGEYARLANVLKLNANLDKLQCAIALAQALNAVVVLKGSDTIISDGKRASITHPPAWLATAGTGDVLAGIIVGLVAQGMNLYEAANAGVWLHAEAAKLHSRGMIAEDVISQLPHVFAHMK